MVSDPERENLLDKTKKELVASLTPETGMCSQWMITDIYKKDWNYAIPFRELGYNSLTEFLTSAELSATFASVYQGASRVYKLKPQESVGHLQDLIAKTARKNPKSNNNRFPPAMQQRYNPNLENNKKRITDLFKGKIGWFRYQEIQLAYEVKYRRKLNSLEIGQLFGIASAKKVFEIVFRNDVDLRMDRNGLLELRSKRQPIPQASGGIVPVARVAPFQSNFEPTRFIPPRMQAANPSFQQPTSNTHMRPFGIDFGNSFTQVNGFSQVNGAVQYQSPEKPEFPNNTNPAPPAAQPGNDIANNNNNEAAAALALKIEANALNQVYREGLAQEGISVKRAAWILGAQSGAEAMTALIINHCQRFNPRMDPDTFVWRLHSVGQHPPDYLDYSSVQSLPPHPVFELARIADTALVDDIPARTISVYFSQYLQPTHFYLIISNDYDKQKKQQKDLKEFYTNLLGKGINCRMAEENLIEGCLCVAEYEQQEDYHRCQVVQVDNVTKTARLLYLDYGSEQNVPFSEILHLDSRFTRLAPFAFSAGFLPVVPPKQQKAFSDELLTRLNELCFESDELSAYVIDYSENKLTVDLCQIIEKEISENEIIKIETWIFEQLINEGLMESVDYHEEESDNAKSARSDNFLSELEEELGEIEIEPEDEGDDEQTDINASHSKLLAEYTRLLRNGQTQAVYEMRDHFCKKRQDLYASIGSANDETLIRQLANEADLMDGFVQSLNTALRANGYSIHASFSADLSDQYF